MAQNSSSSLPIKLIWQIALFAGLTAIAWVLAQVLPIKAQIPGLEGAKAAATVSSKVQVFSLPRLSNDVPSAMEAILNSISSAQTEVYVVARRITSMSLLSALKEREALGVKVYTVLSPDTTADFAGSKLAKWLKDNDLTSVYKDMLTSTSHLVVVDQTLVYISDLPFSEKAFEPGEKDREQAVLGFVYKIEDPALARELSRGIKARIVKNNKLL